MHLFWRLAIDPMRVSIISLAPAWEGFIRAEGPMKGLRCLQARGPWWRENWICSGSVKAKQTWSQERKRPESKRVAETGDMVWDRLTEDFQTQRILDATFSKLFGSLLGFAVGKLYLFLFLRNKKRRRGLEKHFGQKIALEETIFWWVSAKWIRNMWTEFPLKYKWIE